MNDPDFFYCLVMFPYPSGKGLHIGHYYNYAIMDSYCNMLRYKGHKVFQPFGYDAFGLPAENYSKSVGRDPRDVTNENIETFRKQMQRMNTQYEELLVTSEVHFYKWSQYLFYKLQEHGLAYKATGDVNWCPSCETVLANEQVQDNHCERCHAAIQMKNMEQWYFKITAYRDRLIKNLDHLDYPESTITQQRNWLANQKDWCVSRQRKWGTPIPIPMSEETLDTFVDSSIYFLRYLDPFNEGHLVSRERYKQVDLYVGGHEHACMHLIYARFIHMFLFDIGEVPVEEPFKRLVHQGMISFQGEKMSKSKGNIISPDDYDPDVLRMYLMFIGHYFDGGEWSDKNIIGIKRFFSRFSIWMRQATRTGQRLQLQEFQDRLFDLTERFKFNKVVSEFMTFLNQNKNAIIDLHSRDHLVNLLKIYAPGFNLENSPTGFAGNY